MRSFFAETLWDLLGLAARGPREEAPSAGPVALRVGPVAPRVGRGPADSPAPLEPDATSPRANAPLAERHVKPRSESSIEPRSSRARDRAPVTSMQDRYDAMVRDMLARYGVRVRKWRSGSSGVAWEVEYRDGTLARWIEAPRPRGPMSAAIFLHEIGHHAIGFHRYKPRCLEEYHAWQFALSEMERLGLNVTESVRHRVHDSLHYAVSKARRRGIKRLPEELLAYVRPRSRARRAAA